jgi:hypothetical protein
MIDVMGDSSRTTLEAVIATLDQDLLHRKDSLRSLRQHEAMVLMNAISCADHRAPRQQTEMHLRAV